MPNKMVDGILVPTTAEDDAQLAADLARPPPEVYVPVPVLRRRVKAAGKWPQLSALLDTLPKADYHEIFALEQGVARSDPKVRDMLARVGLDPDAILVAP